MRTHTYRSPAEDRRKTAGPQPFDHGDRAERKSTDARARRLSVQTERVGHAIIVITCFD
jgi:hypothetical protein